MIRPFCFDRYPSEMAIAERFQSFDANFIWLVEINNIQSFLTLGATASLVHATHLANYGSRYIAEDICAISNRAALLCFKRT
jgi:hypothetical protein